MTQPVIIELALNGETSRERNPNVSRIPSAIAAETNACLDRGASIIHNHSGDIGLTGDAAARHYGAAWKIIFERHPAAILCPTGAAGQNEAESVSHFVPCGREEGARLGPLDPGSMNMPLSGGGFGGARMLSYVNDYAKIDRLLGVLAKAGMGASIGIYEPGFLRATVALHRAGRLPPGSFVKFYFFGGRNYFDGTPCIGFGLNPTAAALDCYLDILGDTGLPWAAAVVGGDVFRSGMAKLAISRGGGVRLGLEDYAGDRVPTNAELLDEVVGLCRSLGRTPATASEAADLLGLP
jgi:3-keto-5-aminohexanoate cleavage enzyme